MAGTNLSLTETINSIDILHSIVINSINNNANQYVVISIHRGINNFSFFSLNIHYIKKVSYKTT